MRERKALILAGPNGAGKTTFAREFLAGDAQCPEFINAHMIAVELLPENPSGAALRAGREMVRRIQRATEQLLRLGDVSLERDSLSKRLWLIARMRGRISRHPLVLVAAVCRCCD